MVGVIMSTLIQKLQYNDAIMDKITKKVYIVLHEELHFVWVIPDGGGEAPSELRKSKINLGYTKVDPTVVRVLYGKEGTDINGDANKSE